VGAGYSVVLRLSDSGSDSTLITLSGSARDGNALIPALDRLARQMRRKLGENPAAVRATRSVGVIITPSFEAYRKIEQGADYANATGDMAGGLRFVRDALELDPDCAAAYGEMATVFSNMGKPDSAVWACDQALSRPRRLTDEQRLATEATRSFCKADFDGARQTLDRQLALFPAGPGAYGAYSLRALVNLFGRRFAEAADDARRSNSGELAPFGPTQIGLSEQCQREVTAGRLDDAEKTLGRLKGWFWGFNSLNLAVARDDWARVDSLCASLSYPFVQSTVVNLRIVRHLRRGELRAARDDMAQEALREAPGSYRASIRRSLALAMIIGTPVPLDVHLEGDSANTSVITRGWRSALAGDLPARAVSWRCSAGVALTSGRAPEPPTDSSRPRSQPPRTAGAM
jgi:hypothetical protein